MPYGAMPAPGQSGASPSTSQAPPAQPPAGNQGQGAGQAQQAVQMIETGFQKLGELMKAAGPNLDPQDLKLFHSAVQSVDLLMQSLMAPPDQAGPAKAAPSQPMPANANAQAQPAPQY